MPIWIGEKSDARARGGNAASCGPCGGAVPSMAEGTGGVEPAGRAKKATAEQLKALEPEAYGEA